MGTPPPNLLQMRGSIGQVAEVGSNIRISMETVGGPAIIFHRYHEKGTTKRRVDR